MKSFKSVKKAKGYTLIELTVVFVLVILIASTLTSMLSQQVQFYTWWNTQRFIAEEAPLANNIVVRLFARADSFRTITTDGVDTMQLGFVNDAGATTYGVISYNAGALQYSYNGTPAWNIASGLSSASFNTVADTLQFTLTGPYGGQVTYAATPAL